MRPAGGGIDAGWKTFGSSVTGLEPEFHFSAEKEGSPCNAANRLVVGMSETRIMNHLILFRPGALLRLPSFLFHPVLGKAFARGLKLNLIIRLAFRSAVLAARKP